MKVKIHHFWVLFDKQCEKSKQYENNFSYILTVNRFI
jgi:hypothetical protein